MTCRFLRRFFSFSPYMSHDLGQAPRIFAEKFQLTTDKKIPIMQTNKSQDVMNQEYQEFMLMFEQMRAQGLNPRVCDTPVPYRMRHPTRRGGQVEHREGVDAGVRRVAPLFFFEHIETLISDSVSRTGQTRHANGVNTVCCNCQS